MAYAPFTWYDGSGGGTPLTAHRLNVIEQGISEAHELVEAIPPLLTGFASENQVMPEGGSSGQVLTKVSPASYDVEWRNPDPVIIDPGGGGGGGETVIIQAPAGPIAVLHQNAQQTLSSGNWVTMIWQTEIIDTHNVHSGTSSRITVPPNWAGYYEINAHVVMGTSNDDEPDGRRGSRLLINGDAARTRQETQLDSSHWTTSPQSHAIVNLAVGDYIEVQAYHQNGNSYGTKTWITPMLTSAFTVKWLRAA